MVNALPPILSIFVGQHDFCCGKRALTTLAAAMLLSEIAQGVPVQQRDRAAPCPAPARSARIRRKAAPAYFLYQWQL